jgi:class 3 adenylate cyclase
LGPKRSGDIYTSTDLALLTAVANAVSMQLEHMDQEKITREAREVFSTINQYTQTVSALVEKFGGSVVEFNGDGMMAVFGAPTPLPHKERTAVRAGQEVITKVRDLAGPDRERSP